MGKNGAMNRKLLFVSLLSFYPTKTTTITLSKGFLAESHEWKVLFRLQKHKIKSNLLYLCAKGSYSWGKTLFFWTHLGGLFKCGRDRILLTLSAASLQTVSLALKVVLVASAASVVERLAAVGGGVVEVTRDQGVARPVVYRRCAGLCVGEEWERRVTIRDPPQSVCDRCVRAEWSGR